MEQRSEERVESHIRFFVHVHECAARADLVGLSISCEAVDFSPNGLQFHADETLPVGTVLNITIGVDEPFAMFLLQGAVRWTRPVDKGCFAGILLHDAKGTDFGSWQQQFKDLFR